MTRLAAPDTGPDATIQTAGDLAAPVLRVGDAVTIGRDPDCDLVLDDPLVSREQARVRRESGGYVLEDLGSANGTFLERGADHRPVTAPVALENGDVIRAGSSRLHFTLEAAARPDPRGGQPWTQPIRWSTVAAGFGLFFTGFFVWALAAVLAPSISRDLGFGPFEATLLPAIALIGGAVARLAFGPLTDRRGPLLAGSASLVLTFLPLLALWLGGSAAAVVWPAVALLGIGLAAMPIAVPMASQRTAPERRGLALGIVSSGSVGSVVAALLGPALAGAIGWRLVFGLSIVLVALTLGLFIWGARGGWTPPPAGAWRLTVRSSGLWTATLLYCITFGGFAGLYAFLPTMLREPTLRYALGAGAAGLVVALGALLGSIARPISGTLADRFSPLRVLPVEIALAAVLLVVVGSLPVGGALVALIAIMTVFEAGTGACLKLAAQRLGTAVGAGLGLLGCVGSAVGFAFAKLLPSVVETTGTPAAAFAVLAAPPAAVATWIFIAARLEPNLTRRPVTPPGPHLAGLDAFGAAVDYFPVGPELTIGRAPGNRLVLATDDLVSRRHARLQTEDGQVLLEDLDSTNGTMLWRDDRWQPVRREALRDKDTFVIGSQLFRYETGTDRQKGT